MGDEKILKPVVPLGLQTLIDKCKELYPSQPNPLQVTTVLKYWLGGQDPLDYISMYYNAGDQNIPPHWHYITFGLSDLHGDGRVHPIENNEYSGMGFELSFRLIKPKGADEDPKVDLIKNPYGRPPTWPANLLQALARYVFQTGNRLCSGDNIPWRKSLDHSMSKIQHMLIVEDVQLKQVNTVNGTVDFCQIVGVTEEELEQASRWNGNGVLNLLKRNVSTGGEFLITDMSRSHSVFELFPETLVQLEHDLENEGSDLAGVNADFIFKEIPKTQIKSEFGSDFLDEQSCMVGINNITLKTEEPCENEESTNHSMSSSVSNSLNQYYPLDSQKPKECRVIHLDGLHFTIAPYAHKFLKLAIKDRIRHGRHFTFKCQNLAVTFVSESVTGSVVTRENPYGVLGYWMQVLISDDLIPKMLSAFTDISSSSAEIECPKVFEWPEHNLTIVIDHPIKNSTV